MRESIFAGVFLVAAIYTGLSEGRTTGSRCGLVLLYAACDYAVAARVLEKNLASRLPLMGWFRPCSCPASKRSWQGAPTDKEHAMSQTLNTAIVVIGIDIGKTRSTSDGHDMRGAIVLRQKWVAWPRWRRGSPIYRLPDRQ